MADNTVYPATGLTGGTDHDLDGYDGNDLVEDDMAIVIDDDYIYLYTLKADSQAESSPDYIRPDTNPGSFTWHKVSVVNSCISESNVTQHIAAIDHDSLLNFVATEHVVLPNTIANVLSDHSKATHDALNIDADTLDSYDASYFAVAADTQTALDLRCLESVFGTAIGTGLLLDSTTLKVSAILQKYHGVDPSANVLSFLGAANYAAMLTLLQTTLDGRYELDTHLHDTETLQCDAITSDGGAFTFTTSSTLTFTGASAYTFSGGGAAVTLNIGVQNTREGRIFLYGDVTGFDKGGRIDLYMADDYNNTYENYSIQVKEDDLILGRSGDTDALKLDPSSNFHVTTGDIYITTGDLYAQVSGTTKIFLDAANATLYIGDDDTTAGLLYLYGSSSTAGGKAYWYLGDDNDSVIEYYAIQISADDFLIGPDTDSDLIKIVGGASPQVTITANGLDVTGNITVSGNVDGVDIAVFKTAYDAHVHDGHTIQCDGITSDGGAFAFTTSGKITFETGGNNVDFDETVLVDALIIPNAGNIGSASATTAIAIASDGVITFVDDIKIKDIGTIGTATTPAAITLAADGTLTLATCIDAGADVDKFLVWDASGNIDYRTGAELFADITTNIEGSFYTETEVDTWRNSTTQTEMGYVHGVTSDIQTQLDARCLESVFGTAIGTGLLLDSTTLKASAILQKYHGVDPSANVLSLLGAANYAAMLALLTGQAGAAFSWNSQNLTAVGTIACGTITSGGNLVIADAGTIGSTTATTAITIASTGIVTFVDDIILKDAATIGVTSSTSAITIASTGIVTFVDDIKIKDAGTIGNASVAGAITLNANGTVTFSGAIYSGVGLVLGVEDNTEGVFYVYGGGNVGGMCAYYVGGNYDGSGTDYYFLGVNGSSDDFFIGPDNDTDVITILGGATPTLQLTTAVQVDGILTAAGNILISDAGTIGSATATTAITIASTGIVTFVDDIILKDSATIGVTSSTNAITIASTGIVTFVDDIILKDSATIGVTSSTSAITIASTGIVSFIDDIKIKDGGTIGTATDPDSITIASTGEVTLSQTLVLSDVVNAGVDTDKFLVLDTGGNVDYRTGAQVADDIGAAAGAAVPPRSYLAGLQMTNDAGDTDHDIEIGIGTCLDEGAADTAITLAAVHTKQIDAICTTGDDQGGMPNALLAVDTWYHVFVITADGTTVEAGFDTSRTAANLIADHTGSGGSDWSGFTKYRRIGSILTDGSSNIIQFVQAGDHFIWVDPPEDMSNLSVSTTAQLVVMSSPPDVKCRIQFNFSGQAAGQVDKTIYFSSPDATDEAANTMAAPLGVTNYTTAGREWPGYCEVRTNTASQIRVRCGDTKTVYVATLAYIDRRGRDD